MMASRPGDPAGRPEPGQILLVIHDFTARSSDELSLIRGDHVELVERDDDFGDGWYLGRHLINGSTGLFPEVYTKLVLRDSAAVTPTPKQGPTSHLTSLQPPSTIKEQSWDSRNSVPVAEPEKPSQIIRHASASAVPDSNKIPSPLAPPISLENGSGSSMPKSPLSSSVAPRNMSLISATNLGALDQDSPVMNETLNVIQEHITDMNASRHGNMMDRRGANDSGSEYSSHLDRRMSYINGEETDEEDENRHSQGEVGGWTPNQVAEYLATMGVELKHCDVFRDQEITGEVLLGMDQTSVFLKEFELGSVGRRLKTWQKIKSLQDEVKGVNVRRTTMTYGSDVGSEDNRSRSNTMTVMPRIPSVNERPVSQQQNYRYSQQQVVRTDLMVSPSPVSPLTDSPTRPTSASRPSAASIRELNHSRRHSSIDSGAVLQMPKTPDGILPHTPISLIAAHKKLPSFDRNWTMGSQSPASASLPVSATVSKTALGSEEDLQTGLNVTSPAEFERGYDRGYFSGGEAEGRPKNTLRKRTGNVAPHSRNSSYTDEQRIRSATTNARHSRFGSVDSMRESHLSSASQKYYGVSGRRKPSSSEIMRPPPPPKDGPSPTVTRLDGNNTDSAKSPVTGQTADWLSPEASRFLGIRATSDSVTGNEKARATSSTDNVISPKDGSITSPSRGGSSTTSGGPSFELESPTTSKPGSSATTPGSGSSRKKSKKETSAYTKGLEKKTPQESMLDCDYCGWMKKKSTNLMTTWKPRLFILKGRRLSYYYSESDDQEQGLIDISYHRVLPADNDRLTGLHASLTGATNSPASPLNSITPTIASMEAGAEKSPGDSMFIFKLVPPRAGLSRVTFTKPTVHYFAVPNITQGRLWMAALMKATIDRDETKPVITTYQQKTISLAKARAMRHRPPALMNLDEKVEEDPVKTPVTDLSGLNIRGIIFDRDPAGDSGVSGLSKLDPKNDSASTLPYGKTDVMLPQTA